MSEHTGALRRLNFDCVTVIVRTINTMKCFAFVFALLVPMATGQQLLSSTVRETAPRPQQTTPGSQPTESPAYNALMARAHDRLRLLCQAKNGTLPYWSDNTCSSYLACADDTLSVQACNPGTAYSYFHRVCVTADKVDCQAQNEQFSAIIRTVVAPRFYQSQPVPTADSNDDDDDADDDSSDDKDDGKDDDPDMTIDIEDLPSIPVDMSNALSVPLAKTTCQRLGKEAVKQLETSMNSALLMLVGCPEQSCDVQLFHIDC